MLYHSNLFGFTQYHYYNKKNKREAEGKREVLEDLVSKKRKGRIVF